MKRGKRADYSHYTVTFMRMRRSLIKNPTAPIKFVLPRQAAIDLDQNPAGLLIAVYVSLTQLDLGTGVRAWRKFVCQLSIGKKNLATDFSHTYSQK